MSRKAKQLPRRQRAKLLDLATFWSTDLTPAERREFGNSFVRFQEHVERVAERLIKSGFDEK